MKHQPRSTIADVRKATGTHSDMGSKTINEKQQSEENIIQWLASFPLGLVVIGLLVMLGLFQAVQLVFWVIDLV